MEIDGVHIYEADVKTIEWLTKNVQKVQDEVLSTILSRNRNTEYLSRFRLQPRAENGQQPRTINNSDYEDDDLGKEWFRKMVPVVDYEALEPYIRRLVHDDPISTNNLLCAQPIYELLASSGTSAGKMKLFPAIEEDLDRRHFYLNIVTPVINQYSPGLDKGKGLYFLFAKYESKAPSGLFVRPVLTSYLKSDQFRQGISKCASHTSPIEAILCPDFSQSMYCQMLCGLVLKDEVLRMGATFATGFLRVIRFLEENWTCLCHDIHEGQLNPKITDEPMRAAVMKLLSIPNPALAESIRMECSKDSWQGIIGRIWKRARYIDTIVTGTMSQYIPMLDYYTGGLPLVSSAYGSSECLFGINLKPLAKPSEVSYTFLPNFGYFEFIPVETSDGGIGEDSNIGNNEISELAHVELGKEYEVVVTTYAGLYRYKMGDVVRVTGFYNQAPQFVYVQRKKVVPGLDFDKTDEATLHQAIQNASKLLLECSEGGAWKLQDYTSWTDASSLPGHYVIFWEIRQEQPNIIIPETLLEECCLCVEESLDAVYRELRNEGSTVGPLEIRLVKRGTFDALMDYFVSQVGSSPSQYKTPRCIHSPVALSILDSNVLQASCSPRYPSRPTSISTQES